MGEKFKKYSKAEESCPLFPTLSQLVIASAIMPLQQHYPTGPGRIYRPGYQVRKSSADSRDSRDSHVITAAPTAFLEGLGRGLLGTVRVLFSALNWVNSQTLPVLRLYLYIQPPTPGLCMYTKTYEVLTVLETSKKRQKKNPKGTDKSLELFSYFKYLPCLAFK